MIEALVIVALSGGVSAALWFWYNTEDRKIERALMKKAPCKIEDVQEGAIVKVAGKVQVEDKFLEAPFSGQKCVYFNATVAEGDKNSWTEILRECETVDFWVEDNTGRALVRGATLKVAVVKDTEFASGIWNDAPERLERFLARHGEKSTGWFLNRKLMYKEGIFALDEPVAVLGKARWEHDPDPKQSGKGYRDAPKRLVLDALPEGHVFGSDASATLE